MAAVGRRIAGTLVLIGLTAGQNMRSGAAEDSIIREVEGLPGLSSRQCAAAASELARAILDLPSSEQKLSLATSLAERASESKCGRNALRAVAVALAKAIGNEPASGDAGLQPYVALARLALHKGVVVELKSPVYEFALRRVEQTERQRKATFSLKDLTGKLWSLRELRGKVVLVNFWATWCGPCRKELPELDELYKRFQDDGFLVLAISSEEKRVVREFLENRPYSFPILLDPGAKTTAAYQVEGVPKSFVYDRDGMLIMVATGGEQTVNQQFMEVLTQAGLK